MSEIDVSKCKFYSIYCSNSCVFDDVPCVENKNCHFRQLQKEKQNAQDTYEMWQASLESIEILKQENEELKEMYRLSCLKCEYKNTKTDLEKAEQKLEKIKGVIENSCVTIQIELYTRTHCHACNRLDSRETVEKIKEIIEEK